MLVLATFLKHITSLFVCYLHEPTKIEFLTLKNCNNSFLMIEVMLLMNISNMHIQMERIYSQRSYVWTN